MFKRIPIVGFVFIFLVGWMLGVICIVTFIMELEEPGAGGAELGLRGGSAVEGGAGATTRRNLDKRREGDSKSRSGGSGNHGSGNYGSRGIGGVGRGHNVVQVHSSSTLMKKRTSKDVVTRETTKKPLGFLSRVWGAIPSRTTGGEKENIDAHKSTEEATPIPTLPVAHALPRFSLNDTFRDDEADQSIVYLDFPADDRFFTLDNYRALESVLSVYPSAVVRCLLPAPPDAFVIKIGNQLSVNHFSKYKRRGYDIEVVPVGLMNKGYTAQFGKRYWTKWAEECCSKCTSVKCRSSDRVQPYHLHTYIRLSKVKTFFFLCFCVCE